MKYWILKTEPETYSFEDLLRDKKTRWDGVRNYQARNNLRGTSVGDLVFVYESGGPKSAVGIAKVVRGAYPDPKTKEDWSAIDIAPVKKLKIPITLEVMKADKILKNMTLVKQSRLSVCQITKEEYEHLLNLGES